MSTIVERLRNVDDADARLIARFEALDFEIEYIREDIESRYSDEDLDRAYRSIMANQISSDDFKTAVGKEFEAQVLFLEGVVVLTLPSTRYDGSVASFDRHEELPINRLIDVASDIEH
jgi:hypothetical protein